MERSEALCCENIEITALDVEVFCRENVCDCGYRQIFKVRI